MRRETRRREREVDGVSVLDLGVETIANEGAVYAAYMLALGDLFGLCDLKYIREVLTIRRLRKSF